MKVKYVGPSHEVIAVRDGFGVTFPHGVPTEIDDEWGARLCEQGIFQEVKSKKADPAAPTAEEAE